MIADSTTRRSLLASGALGLYGAAAAKAMASQAPAPGAQEPPRPEPESGALSARAFGAVADGSHRPLAERFATLAAAQQIFPFATSLAQTLDWAGIQAAINALGGRPGRVHLPAGRYRISDTIRVPNLTHLFGDGAGISIIDNQNTILHAPQIVNSDASMVGVAITSLSLHGGTHGVKISVPQGEIAYIALEGVVFALQSEKNFECDHLLQSSEFRQCGFGDSPYGVVVGGKTTNAVNFYDCNFTAHSRTHLQLNGAEAVNFYGGKFEGGGAAPNPTGEERVTIALDSAAAINFHGVYFEATHPILLKETRSRNSVGFFGCHFTGADVGQGPIPFRFISDGVVTFGTNDWLAPSEGPARMLLIGDNGQRLGASGNGVQLAYRTPRQALAASPTASAAGEIVLARVRRLGPVQHAGVALLSGELVLHGELSMPGRGPTLLSRRYHLRLSSRAAGPIELRAALIARCDDGEDDLPLTIALHGGASAADASLVARLGSAGARATLQWSLQHLASTGTGQVRLEADVANGS